MPYKFETERKRIPKEKDRRIKLTDEQREEIRKLYATGLYSQRKLAKKFGVSRRTIVFTIYPERLEENKKRRQECGGSKIYYDKDKHREYMRRHRQYKRQLAEKGELE
mgnify:FL=1